MINRRTLFFPVLALLASLSGCMEGSHLQIGEKAPGIATKTLQDVGGDFSRITTYRYPDPRMYQYSLDEALATGKPMVVEFATPGHCSPCDQQLQMLKGLIDKYGSQVLFLHMDQYKNPEAYKAFQVMGDPWTFVIDKAKTVRYVQSGRILYQELDAAINKVLPAG